MPPERSPLRVAMVAARFFPYAGGIETHVYEVARRLAGSDIDLTVLTTDPSRTLPREETIDGIRVRRFAAWPAERDYYFAPGIYAAVAEGGWDVMHCQGIHTLAPPLAMLAARRTRIPYAVTFHTGGHSSRLRHSSRRLQWLLLRPLLAHAARLIGVSRFEAELFRRSLRLPRAQFSVIPNGGRLPQTSCAPRQADGSLLISVGRLEKYKGHQRAITALPLVRARRPDARLLILGSGPYECKLRALVRRLDLADCVEIRSIPASDRQGMADTVAGAALVLLLSDYEAHPVATMEALALHRPVLVADTTGLSELAERGLVRAIPRDSSAATTAAAILAQLDNPLMPAAVALPTWESCTASLAAVYRAIAVQERCRS